MLSYLVKDNEVKGDGVDALVEIHPLQIQVAPRLLQLLL